MTTVEAPERFVREKQVAAELGVSPQMVSKLVMTGALPATKVGRAVLIRRKDLERFLRQRRVRPRRRRGS